MKKHAEFSEDRSKRYALVRDWRDEIKSSGRTILFVMLNPSKAGEVDDDPTVRKVIGFARRWGFGRVVVVNLIATVMTDPKELPEWCGIDKYNCAVIRRWVAKVDMVTIAWGSQSRGLAHRIGLSELVSEFRKVTPATSLYCIGKTKTGAPLHPSRALYTVKPKVWKSSK